MQSNKAKEEKSKEILFVWFKKSKHIVSIIQTYCNMVHILSSSFRNDS